MSQRVSQPKYPVEQRGPSYSAYLAKLRRRSHWRARAFGRPVRMFLRRKRGTPAQIGKPFPVRALAGRLPKMPTLKRKVIPPVPREEAAQLKRIPSEYLREAYKEARLGPFPISLPKPDGSWVRINDKEELIEFYAGTFGGHPIEPEEEYREHIYGPKTPRPRITKKSVPIKKLPVGVSYLRDEVVEEVGPRTIVPTTVREPHRSLREAQASALRWQKLGKRATVDMGLVKLGKYVVLISG